MNHSESLNELALFAGAGGGILGGLLCGFRTVCAVEWDEHARQCLTARQDDGCLEPFPVWDDVQTFDGKPWRGVVDIVTGGFPCQDISAAGKGAGIEGERSGMWAHMARIVGEVLPQYVLVENSPLLVGRGLAVVLGDLAAMGYDARWGVVGAHHVGYPHKRERIWILAYAAEKRWIPKLLPSQKLCAGSLDSVIAGVRESLIRDEDIAGNVRAAYGVAGWVDRLERIGNGQVPDVVHLAWNLLQPQDSLSKSNRFGSDTANTG